MLIGEAHRELDHQDGQEEREEESGQEPYSRFLQERMGEAVSKPRIGKFE
jgi:hypothetical protein